MADSRTMDTYPPLRERIDRLCQGRPWGVVGASAIVRDEEAYYFEISKSKFWSEQEDGRIAVGIGGIGGHIEEGENEIACLHREALEELGVEVQVLPSAETHLLFSERWVGKERLPASNSPAPYLCTIGPKKTSLVAALPYDFLCIVTFEALLLGQPKADDVYGLMRIEIGAIRDVLGPDTISLAAAQDHPGVQLQLNGELEEDCVLRPMFTARSFLLLLQSGQATVSQRL
jgi:8-oxo-dGTP pyrophosphatase MutT (NUDIX family)